MSEQKGTIFKVYLFRNGSVTVKLWKHKGKLQDRKYPPPIRGLDQLPSAIRKKLEAAKIDWPN